MRATSTLRQAVFGLAILLGFGLCATTRGTAQNGRLNDDQKRYVLEFDRAPWKAVFERLSDVSGLAFRNSDDPLPTGTFSYINPGVNGVKRTYTVAEIIEIINDGLVPRYTLLRRGASFRVVPADVPIEFLPQVTREELAHRGRNEVVIVEVQLKGLNAEELAPEAKKFLGAFGEMTPLPFTNQMILQGQAAQLRVWLDIIEEKDKTGPFETYQHACQYVKASQAEKLLRDFLGDPKKNRSYHIASEERTNTIYVNGPPEKVEQAKKLMAKLDVPQYSPRPIVLGAPTFQTYAIPAGNADAIAKILGDVYKTSATLRVTATSNSVLLVYGLPNEHLEFAALLAPFNIPPVNVKDGPESRDVVRFAERAPSFGRAMRGRSGSSRRSLEARLDQLIAELEAIRREVRHRR